MNNNNYLKFISIYCIVLLLFLFNNRCFAQCNGWGNLQLQDSVFYNPAFGVALSPESDRLNRPFIYVAANTGGVKVFDKNASGNPTLVTTISKADLGNLDAINLYQDSIWLYVCLGNIWDTTQAAGLAIVDISDPLQPLVLNNYIHTGFNGGAGAVEVRGDYAYLAANDNGLIILNISNKSNIQFVSSLLLNINFPHTNVGSASMYNARGIAIKDTYAYICYDRGGLRVIDISNVNSPVQSSQYCFSNLINYATAYNNIVIHGNTAYVSIDYYGLEILDITNPLNISQIGWWHPSTWCDTTNLYNVWASSDGHCNELAYDSVCQIVYVASGKSDLVAIDVSLPSSPITCQIYGTPIDDYGTWGMDLHGNEINLAYIWSPFFPPYSNYTGIKTLQTSCLPNAVFYNSVASAIQVSPNPATEFITFNLDNSIPERIKIVFVNCLGIEYRSEAIRVNNNQYMADQLNLPDGIYFLRYTLDEMPIKCSNKIIIKK